MMKNNMQDKAYKVIKTHFGVRKSKYAHIKGIRVIKQKLEEQMIGVVI